MAHDGSTVLRPAGKDRCMVRGARHASAAVLCLALLGAAAGCGSAPPRTGASPPAPSPVASSAASPSPSPSPAAPAPFVVPSGVVAGVAVFDRRAGAFVEQRQVTTRFRSASLVKLLIALDYLWNRGPGYTVPAADRGRLDLMLRSSDDDAASYFWNGDGRDQVVTRMVGRLGLKDTAPPSAVGKTGWGSTSLSAADVMRVYRYLLDSAPAPVRDYVMGNLHQSTPCGTDHYHQTFGIPSAFNRPWAVKQGWYGFGDTPADPCATGAAAARPDPGTVPVSILSGAVLHTTGTVGDGDRTIVVVLTQHPEGTSFATASATLTGLVRSLSVPGGVPVSR
jgi:hypothetical protein